MSQDQTFRRIGAVALALAAGLWAAFLSAAEEGPRFHVAFTTDSKQTMTERAAFAPDTPKVYVIYMLADVPKGARLKALWFAEKVEGLAENTKFDQAETVYSAAANGGAFSEGKPAKGNWPLGSYRVDLFINDKLDKSVHFKVSR